MPIKLGVNNATRRLAGGVFPGSVARPAFRSQFVRARFIGTRTVDATFFVRSVAKKSQDARGHEEHMAENHQRVSHDLRRKHPNIQSLSCS